MKNKVISLDKLVKDIFLEAEKMSKGDKKLKQTILKQFARKFSHGKFGMNSR